MANRSSYDCIMRMGTCPARTAKKPYQALKHGTDMRTEYQNGASKLTGAAIWVAMICTIPSPKVLSKARKKLLLHLSTYRVKVTGPMLHRM